MNRDPPDLEVDREISRWLRRISERGSAARQYLDGDSLQKAVETSLLVQHFVKQQRIGPALEASRRLSEMEMHLPKEDRSWQIVHHALLCMPIRS